MKRSLQLKIVFVLGYVALCTTLVLAGHRAEAPSEEGPAVPAFSTE